MKKTVLTFGLISGVILATLMAATIPFADQIGFDRSMYVGYTTMVLAFSLIFFGIRSYRENVGDGYISFGRALAVGFLIMGISTLCYVIAWEIIYFGGFVPGFFDKMIAHQLEKMRQSGSTEQQIAEMAKYYLSWKPFFDNPIKSALFTSLETSFPGIIITFLSAIILRKRRKEEVGAAQLA